MQKQCSRREMRNLPLRVMKRPHVLTHLIYYISHTVIPPVYGIDNIGWSLQLFFLIFKSNSLKKLMLCISSTVKKFHDFCDRFRCSRNTLNIHRYLLGRRENTFSCHLWTKLYLKPIKIEN